MKTNSNNRYLKPALISFALLNVKLAVIAFSVVFLFQENTSESFEQIAFGDFNTEVNKVYQEEIEILALASSNENLALPIFTKK